MPAKVVANWVEAAVVVVVLLTILAVGGWLRWQFATSVSLHVDEFTTLWAAERVQELGTPRMPSGVLYTRGLLSTYLEAGALTLANARERVAEAGSMAPLYLAGRIPSVLTGLLTILLVYVVGRRGWNRGVGLLAALGLALLPEAIMWSGRARFYALFQLLALLLVWVTWEWIRPRATTPGRSEQPERAVDKWGRALLWAFLFALSLFTQEQTLLLLPGLLLAMLIWRGWRWVVAPPQVVAIVLAAATAIARYVVEIRGQPGYFETIQSTRPYVGLVFDLRGAWESYSGLFVAPERMVWSLLALLATGVALVLWLRAISVHSLPRAQQSSLFHALNLLLPLGAIFMLVGTTWRDPRYLFFLQPLWLLLGAAGAWQIVEWVVRPDRRAAMWQAVGMAGVGLLMATLLWPAALETSRMQEVDYAYALEQVKAQRAPGDIVLSPQPPACALVLGPCDGFAIQRAYEEYVVPRDGEVVDRWSGAPVISSSEALSATVATAQRAWFVGDAYRLATRYDAEYLRVLLSHFTPIVNDRGVVVLRSDGLQSTPTLDTALANGAPLRFGPLEMVQARRNDDFGPGTPLIVDLEWVGVEPIAAQINTSVRLVNRAGEIVAQSDGPPAAGVIPTTLFFDTPLPDTKVITLPATLPNDRYRIDVAAYEVAQEADGSQRITPLGEPQPVGWILNATNQRPLLPPLGTWENGITLLAAGSQPVQPSAGATLNVDLTWSSSGPTSTPLTAFVHLIDPAGSVVAQQDKQPEDGFFPTTAWQAEHGPITDAFTLPLPAELAPGTWQVVTGWYDAASGARIPATGGDAIEALTFEIP